jgi:hypothetical protein
MFFSLWRRLRSSSSGPSRRKRCLGVRQVSFRPQLDPLEDRLLPAPVAAGILTLDSGPSTLQQAAAAPLPGAVIDLQQTGLTPPAASNQMKVTLNENSAANVVPLGAVFAAMSDIHPKDGLQLSILGNTNPGLVTTDLSGADLSLTCAPGKLGTATITVGAIDADGVSVRETIIVTVRPLQSAPTAGLPIVPTPPQAM